MSKATPLVGYLDSWENNDTKDNCQYSSNYKQLVLTVSNLGGHELFAVLDVEPDL